MTVNVVFLYVRLNGMFACVAFLHALVVSVLETRTLMDLSDLWDFSTLPAIVFILPVISL